MNFNESHIISALWLDLSTLTTTLILIPTHLPAHCTTQHRKKKKNGPWITGLDAAYDHGNACQRGTSIRHQWHYQGRACECVRMRARARVYVYYMRVCMHTCARMCMRTCMHVGSKKLR